MDRSTNDDAFKRFLHSKNGTSPTTQYHYAARLDILKAYCKKKKISINNFTQNNLMDFLSYEYKNYKPKTMNHIKSVIVSFIKFHFSKNWYSRFPNLQSICKSQKVMPKYQASQMLTQEEVQTLIQKENDPFWKLVYAVQFFGGCRPGEVCNLKWKDVTLTDEGIYFNVYSHKNNRNFEKFVPLEFSNYIKELQKNSLSEYVFVKKDNKPISRHSLYKRITRLSNKIYPDKKVNPYLLRHSIATILYGRAEKGELNDDVVARQMGHTKSMKGTYTHFNIDTLRTNARKIYIKPDYTPEKKIELEEKIKLQDEKLEALAKLFLKKYGEDQTLQNLGVSAAALGVAIAEKKKVDAIRA